MTPPASHTSPDRDRHPGADAVDPVTAAARRLYDAEVALHHAHQSHVDAWITAASDRLHEALLAHLNALAHAHHHGGDR